MIDSIFVSSTAVHTYDFHKFTAIISPPRSFIWIQHNDQLPVGLLAQLVERCAGNYYNYSFSSLPGLVT